METVAGLTEALDAETAENRLLEHPFYRAWAAGDLSLEDLAFYSTQYWRQVEAFPGYLENLARRLPAGRARDMVAANLRDERDDDHPGLWLEFAAALGVREPEVRTTAVEPETRDCVDAFSAATAGRSTAFALGALYAYESQTPEVAQTKIDGLRRHYGIDGPATRYFELHGELDVEHSRELVDALSLVARGPQDLEEARAGARAGATAVYGLLSGVARVRGICN